MQQEGFIVEFASLGRSVKVTAVCTRTGVEASIVGDTSVSREQLRQLAIRKLKYVLNKKAGA